MWKIFFLKRVIYLHLNNDNSIHTYIYKYIFLHTHNHYEFYFWFLKNVKIHNQTIEGSGNYPGENEFKTDFFKGLVGPESLVLNLNTNAIIQATRRVVIDDGKEHVCIYLMSIKKYT